jgi:hypothetical protein
MWHVHASAIVRWGTRPRQVRTGWPGTAQVVPPICTTSANALHLYSVEATSDVSMGCKQHGRAKRGTQTEWLAFDRRCHPTEVCAMFTVALAIRYARARVASVRSRSETHYPAPSECYSKVAPAIAAYHTAVSAVWPISTAGEWGRGRVGQRPTRGALNEQARQPSVDTSAARPAESSTMCQNMRVPSVLVPRPPAFRSNRLKFKR